MRILKKVQTYIDNQYKTPKGIIGMFFGEKMVKQHKIETNWTMELLEVKEGDKLLELGCGAGYAIKKIIKTHAVDEVVGLDISPTVIQSAKIRNKRAIKVQKAKLVKASFDHLPFQNNSFHKIFSIQTIYFWTDIATTLGEIHRVLKQEGDLVLTFSDGKDEEKWDGIKNTMENKLIPVMKVTGFQNVRIIRGPNSRGYHTVSIIGTKKY